MASVTDLNNSYRDRRLEREREGEGERQRERTSKTQGDYASTIQNHVT